MESRHTANVFGTDHSEPPLACGPVRVDGAVTAVSWIPSEAVSGAVYKVPFGVGLAHYDDPPPDVLPDIEAFLAADRARFVNQLTAWVDVRDGVIVDYGHSGEGRIGSSTLRIGGRGLTFAAVSLPDKQSAEPISQTAVRFEQTAGGRTGVPAPRRVSRPPYVEFFAPLAWSTLRLTLYADGTREGELVGASPFPRHWVYDADGRLTHKSARIDYHEWSTKAYGRHTPWGDVDSPAVVSEVETALERGLSLQIMHADAKPQVRRLKAGDTLVEQGEPGDQLYLLLDGILRVEVDGEPLADVGPGALLGERAILESGRRTATLTATTPVTVAIADRAVVDTEALRAVSEVHHREEVGHNDS
jgi:Cyclic nucleotide-binding domain